MINRQSPQTSRRLIRVSGPLLEVQWSDLSGFFRYPCDEMTGLPTQALDSDARIGAATFSYILRRSLNLRPRRLSTCVDEDCSVRRRRYARRRCHTMLLPHHLWMLVILSSMSL